MKEIKLVLSGCEFKAKLIKVLESGQHIHFGLYSYGTFGYSIFVICITLFPLGVFSVTISPFFLFRRIIAIGDKNEILFKEILASSTPTI